MKQETSHSAERKALALLVILSVAGCGGTFPGATTSLGGDTAGERGQLEVLFINNTPFNPVFTFGAFDPLDQFSRPEFGLFAVNDEDRVLPANDRSRIFPIACARTMSLGSPLLLSLIARNRTDADPNPQALIEGVAFFEPASGDSGEAILAETIGAFEVQLGIDFPCDALLIFRFEHDDRLATPFRIEFELIPPKSNSEQPAQKR